MEKVANTQNAGTAKAVKNDAEFKAKKAEAAKKCIERKKERAAAIVTEAKWLIAQAEAKKINLPEDKLNFWKGIANPTVAHSAGGSTLLIEFTQKPNMLESTYTIKKLA